MDSEHSNIKITGEEKRENYKLLWDFMKGSKRYFLAELLLSALVSLADMLDPQIVRIAIDNIIGGAEPDLPAWVIAIVESLGGFAYLGENLWIVALAVLAVAILRVTAQYGTTVYTGKASETLIQSMRNKIFAHIERLPFSWHMKNHSGDIIQRCTSDVEKVRAFVAEQLATIIRIIVLLVLSLYFMLSMDVLLTVVALSMTPAILLFVRIYHKRIYDGFELCEEGEAEVSAMVTENLTGVRVVRAFARESYEKERFIKKNAEYTSMWVKMAHLMANFFITQDIMSMFQIMLVIVIGSVFCVNGRMSAGDLVAFIAYNAMLGWPIRRLGRMIVEMSKADVSLSRVAYIMRSEPEKESEKGEEPDLAQRICFNNINFAYDDAAEVLHDVSFCIEPGSSLGILGGTGSGKSTLMLLLDKLYELPEGGGSITIGGVDIRDIRTGYLRENISMVLQEPFLFSRSIAENIGIRDSKMSEEAIKEAARAACLDESIRGFSGGYDSMVGERGLSLSGGQKQRTAIARALTNPAPIMIFDDSMSALDTETDVRIREELQTRFGKSTVIIISHRISTLSRTDKVIVLDRGRVVEQGSPEELKKGSGIYRRIYEIQSGIQEESHEED
ncbi:MAG TPA: ABC transporter ATP-binding protein [Bacillota bacterium]|nr:ABC transporter ATP-binding protein [Bacillota bacterium]HQC36128.1 ABC transporter ATP-binding protein [Bacillota bacterium]